jgi:hypothetical protein
MLGASFQVMRRNPRPTLGISLLLYGAVNLIIYFTLGAIFGYYLTAITNAQDEDVSAFWSGGLLATFLAPLIPIALSIVVSAILQGIISLEVARSTLGEKLKLRGIWRLARGRIGVLVGWTLLLSGGLFVLALLLVFALVAIGVAGGLAGVIAAVLLGTFLLLGLAVLWVWIDTKLCLVPSILLLERLPLRAAIARSWQLTRGFFWKTLGIRLLVNVIISTALQVITVPITLLATYGGLLINPNGDPTASNVLVVIGSGVIVVFSIVFGSVGLVMESAVVALIYIDIRMRREGLDLELLRFVESRQAGDTSVTDPYLQSPSAEPSAPAATGSPWA